VQSFKRLDSLRHFCAVLQYGDGNSGEEFYDLPEMNSGKDKGEIEGKFELSPYFPLAAFLIFGIKGISTTYNVCQPLPPCATCYQ